MATPPDAETVSAPAAPLDFERLVAAVLPLDHYHRELEPLLPDLVRIVQLNDQLNGAFRRIADRAGFAEGGEVERKHLGDDAEAVHTFFEYVYFASPAFLSTVGEWPLGGVRG
ncbi:hypothetical protein Xaut_0823 [Xanthobacter versatilis]|uniref:Uncharacterized protein n=1 Tax=Xanthobacter autotrophicus (strain ATCC BAA-1158 / Py2) TaxID=78245 RepID=A7IDI1_XANP2|nr:hypothetical protein Xaut_0823 [Xanthobacter autotrophicus Py2]